MTKKFLILMWLLLLVIHLIIFVGEQKNEKIAPMEVSFLNVGQGDAILIDYLKHYQILIDAGPSGKKVLTELSRVMPFGDHILELVIITHPDRDHFVGFLEIIKKYQIKQVLINGQQSEDEVWQALIEELRKRGVKISTVTEGSILKIGHNFKMSFFNPDKVEKNEKAKNDNSVVVRLDYKKNSFLFTGDAGFDAEADMIFDEENLDVDWLKVGHHGSRYSTSKFFLARVTPKVSIISVGENDYGHPTDEVLENLKEVGSRILRTDQWGTITVLCHNVCKIKNLKN